MSQQVFNQSMKANGGGVIINISTSMHWNGSWGFLHDSTAKAGIDAMTKTLAVEWGPHGVKVNGIVPGPIEGTEGFTRINLANLNNKERTNQAFEKAIKNAKKFFNSEKNPYNAAPFKKFMPVRRFGHVNDISNTALFLASSASSFITGTNVVVDGGQWLTAPNTVFTHP